MDGFGHVFSQLFQTCLIQSSDASSFRAFSTANLSVFFLRSRASSKQCCGGAVRSCQQLSHSSTNPGFPGLNVNVFPQSRHFSFDSMGVPCGWFSLDVSGIKLSRGESAAPSVNVRRTSVTRMHERGFPFVCNLSWLYDWRPYAHQSGRSVRNEIE